MDFKGDFHIALSMGKAISAMISDSVANESTDRKHSVRWILTVWLGALSPRGFSRDSVSRIDWLAERSPHKPIFRVSERQLFRPSP